MGRPKKVNYTATSLYKEFRLHPKLKGDMPRGCILATRHPQTKDVEHTFLGELSPLWSRGLLDSCGKALEALEEVSVLPQTDVPVQIAGFKTREDHRFVVAGMERDLADLFLGVYLFRFTYLTRAEVRKFWEESNNRYIVGDTFFV